MRYLALRGSSSQSASMRSGIGQSMPLSRPQRGTITIAVILRGSQNSSETFEGRTGVPGGSLVVKQTSHCYDEEEEDEIQRKHTFVDCSAAGPFHP
jgi:hypothetical protein